MGIKCGVCLNPLPAEFVQRHHITPQSVGRKTDNCRKNISILCSGCHHNLHRISDMILAGKPKGSIVDVVKTAYQSDIAQVRRLLILASHSASEIRAAREGLRDLPAMVPISVEVPRDVYIALKELSLDWRGPRSLTPMIRELLIQTANSRIPSEENQQPDPEQLTEHKF